MKYYKVKPESDQIKVNNSKDFLIANELKTGNELRKLNILNFAHIEKHFTEIEISKNKTYLMFGARFQMK